MDSDGTNRNVKALDTESKMEMRGCKKKRVCVKKPGDKCREGRALGDMVVYPASRQCLLITKE